MNCKLINGKKHAGIILEQLENLTKKLQDHHCITPTLAIVQVGSHGPSSIYVKNKLNVLKKIGMRGTHLHLPLSTKQQTIEDHLEKLNSDPSIHGIIIQLPLPDQLDKKKLLNLLSSDKDVDGLTFYNQGKLFNDIYDGLIPCTPLGCLYLIKKETKNLSGKLAVVIGRSNLVGKPLSTLLLKQGCTMIQAHRKTKNIEKIIINADILVTATGAANFITADMIKPGAQVIDVGITRQSCGKLCGDVDFSGVKNKNISITPVPGGVGPMTVCMLMLNTLQAAYKSLKKDSNLYKNLLQLL